MDDVTQQASSQPALAVGDLEQLLRDLEADSQPGRFDNITLQLAREMYHRLHSAAPECQNVSMAGFESLLNDLERDAVKERSQYLAGYMGSCGREDNKGKARDVFTRLTHDENGRKVSAEEFEKKINQVLGAVFTGHPVFSMNPELAEALAQDAAYQAGSKECGYETDVRLEKALKKPFKPLSLDQEHDESIRAIKNLRAAAGILTDIAIDVGREAYPDEWTGIRYRPVTGATWIPYDGDGRTDISWYKKIEKRMTLQVEGLSSYLPALENLRNGLAKNDKDVVIRLVNKITATIDEIRENRDFYKDYNPEEDPDLTELSRWSRRLEKTRDERITHPGELIGPLEELLQRHTGDKIQKQLVRLISDLDNHGITLAHIHFRINASSVSSAFGNDYHMDLSLDPKTVDNRYGKRIAEILEQTVPGEFTIEDLAREPETILRDMCTIRQITKNLDSHSPIRYLIAETDRAAVPLATLAYAKMVGVDDCIDISILIEDRDGIENAERVVKRMLQNTRFREYIEKRGELNIQFGYSDSGRYDGQIPAQAFIERAEGRILQTLQEAGLGHIRTVFFATHGESDGRGSHPVNIGSRLDHVHKPHTQVLARRLGIDLGHEESFQGGDGFLMFGTVDSSLAYLVQATDFLTTDHRAAVDADPIYRNDRGKFPAKEFFATMRETHARHARNEMKKPDPRYAEMLAVFAGLMPKTGSRPVKRAEQSGGSRDLSRAIPHNGTVKQMGNSSTVFYGGGKAAKMETEDLKDLAHNSPQFRTRLEMVFRAMDMSDPCTLKSYIELFAPSFWLNMARNETDRTTAENYRTIAEYLGEAGYSQQFSNIADAIDSDFQNLFEAREDLDLSDDPLEDSEYKRSLDRKKRNMQVVHGVRIAAMTELFALAAKTPGFSARHDTTRDEMMDRIIRLDRGAIEKLRNIFPVAAEQPARSSAVASLSGERRGYGGYEDEIFGPMEACFDVIDRASHALIHYNNHVG